MIAVGPASAQLTIDGLKTFELSQVVMGGDLNHFAWDFPDKVPGFHFTQSLKLRIDGYILDNVRVKADLDDTSQERRELTVFIEGRIWDITLGDFVAEFENSEFSLFNKKIKGVQAVGTFGDRYQAKLIASRSEGTTQIYRIRGQGEQGMYQLPREALPIVEESVIVYIDHRRLKKELHYRIDYETGRLTFKPEILPIEEYSIITVEYEFEGQQAYKRNLIGVRGTVKLNEKNRVDLIWVSNSDDESSPLVEVTDDTIKPMGHQVFDLVGSFTLGDKLSVKGELARSEKDFNMLQSGDSVEGNASRVEAEYTLPDLSLKVKHGRIEPYFSAVGKAGLAFIGEGEYRTLSGDIDDLQAELLYNVTPRLDLHSIYRRSYTNILSLPDQDRKEYQSREGDLTWRLPKDLNVGLSLARLNRREENPSSDQHISEEKLSIDKMFRYLESKVAYRKREEKHRINPANSRFRKIGEIRLGTREIKALRISTGYKLVENEQGITRAPQNRSENFEVNVSGAWGRKYNMAGLFMKRSTTNHDTRKGTDTTTADLSFKLKPSSMISSTVKLRRVHTLQYVTMGDEDDEEDGEDGETNDDGTPRVQQPVTTTSGNARLDFRPLRNLNARVTHQFNDSKRVTDKFTLTRRDRSSLDIKWSPTAGFNHTLRLKHTHRERRTGNISASRTKNASLDTRKVFKKDLTLSTTVNWEERDDVFNLDSNLEKQVYKLKLKKNLNRFLTASCGYQVSDSTGGGTNTFKSSRAESGIVFSNLARTLNCSVDFYVDKKLTEIMSQKETGTVRLNYRLAEDTDLTGEMKVVRASASDQGDGYLTKQGDLKVYITF